MKRVFRILLFLLVLGGIAAGVYYSMLVEPTAIVLTGIVTTDDVIVSAQVQGRVEKLLVNQGDAVKAGQLLAVIEPQQWQADVNYFANTEKQAATQISESQATLRFQDEQTRSQILQAQADLESAKAQVAQADVDLENTRLTFEREESMFKAKSETQQGYDLARTNYNAQKARGESLIKLVAAAEATLDLDCPGEVLYGRDFARVISRSPDSALIAQGSAVSVGRPKRLA